MEREDAGARPWEEDERGHLDPRRDGEPDGEPDVAARDLPASDGVRPDDEAEEGEGERAEADRERGEDRRQPRPPQLEQLERREHCSEAEGVRVEPGEQRRSGEHAEHARRPDRGPSPLPQRDGREEDGGGDRGGEDERQVPNERGRKVVEKAVRGEWVRPRVPEVVPDERAVADEERPVEVHRRIPRRRPDGEHEPRDGGR